MNSTLAVLYLGADKAGAQQRTRSRDVAQPEAPTARTRRWF